MAKYRYLSPSELRAVLLEYEELVGIDGAL